MEHTKKEIKKYLNSSVDKLVVEKNKIRGLDITKLASYSKKSTKFLDNYKSEVKSIIAKNGITNKDEIDKLESFMYDIMAKRIMDIPPIS